MNGPSAVEFPGESRVHIGLPVRDLERSRSFYETLLGMPPTKTRPGYVKFECTTPSVNLTLNEVAGSEPIQRPATHYGVQVKSTQAVQEAKARLSEAGLPTSVEENTTCCYAVQDKVWVADPDGNQWEVFVVLDANATQRKDEGSTCCAREATQSPANTCC